MLRHSVHDIITGLLRKSACISVAAVLALVLPALTSSGQDKAPVAGKQISAQAAPAKAKTEAPQAGDGLKVFIDPVTHQIRPPEPGESEALSNAAARPPAGPVRFVRHPNGAVGAILDESYMSFSVVKVNADGTLSMECVQGKDKAMATLAKPQAPAKSAGKEQLDVQ